MCQSKSKTKKTRKTKNRKKARKTKKQKTKTKTKKKLKAKLLEKQKNNSKALKIRRKISLQNFLLPINIFWLLTLKCITLAVTSFEVMSRISTALMTISVSFYALGLKITYNAFGSFNWGLSK